MALDFDKVKAASTDDMVSLCLCEFSRFVDGIERIAGALERIAPTADDLQAAATAPAETPQCPCPPELRQKAEAVMGQPVSYRCGLCGKPVEV